MLAAVVAVLVAVLGIDLHVIVRTADGGTVEGTVSIQTLRIDTAYGHAEVLAEHLERIECGETDTVVAAGATIGGKADLGDLEIRPRDGREPVTIPKNRIRSITVIREAALTPGRITTGVARNGLTYHLRMPEDAAEGAKVPAILILHGSNMNSKDYVATIAATWPDLARDFLLIGIDGEQRSSSSTPQSPRFNYTYVNYVGRSTYKGYPGTDRESPALVAEALREITARAPVSKVFVGGHSQGGYLTYSLLMNTPELFAGAFPMSCALIIQCEPRAYADEELKAAQRRLPIAIVHAKDDRVVGFGEGLYAYEAFEDAGWPGLRMFAPEGPGHRFAHLPLEHAVRWLEAMTSDDPAALARFAERAAEEGRWRDVCAAAQHARDLGAAGDVAQRLAAALARAEEGASAAASDLADAPDAAGQREWVERYLTFREVFGLTQAAAAPTAIYAAMRAEQQPRADDLFGRARQAYGRGDHEEGKRLARLILEECPASDKFRLVKRWLE